jgi:hypothetical protein
MTCKKPIDYTQEEVCVWLNAIGLGSRIPDFQENAIDGPVLYTLTVDELEGDLGLSNLQIRKFHQSLQFAETLADTGGYDQTSRLIALEQDNKSLREEVASLNEVIKVLQTQQQTPAPAYQQQPTHDPYYNNAPAPAPAPYYAPAPAPYGAPPPSQPHHHGTLYGRSILDTSDPYGVTLLSP